MTKNNDTFIRVTNAQIYALLQEHGKKLEDIESHVIETNGKVKLAKWVATTAISLIVVVIGLLVNHIATTKVVP